MRKQLRAKIDDVPYEAPHMAFWGGWCIPVTGDDGKWIFTDRQTAIYALEGARRDRRRRAAALWARRKASLSYGGA